MIAVPFLLLSVGWAQRGGGFHGGGGFGGMRGGGFHGGGFHAPAPGSFTTLSRSGFHGGSGFHHPGNGFHHPNNGPFLIIGTGRFHHGFRGYGGYPFYGYGWYDPFWSDWYRSSYDSQADNYVQYQTANEINRLADEVQELREEQRQYRSAPPEPAPQPQGQAKLQQPEDLPVIVVFLDKRIQEVKNYAVANEMLVVLDGNRRKKYPLADIDLAATMKLNDERGVAFDVPNPVITQ
jgi:hypothetical protein